MKAMTDRELYEYLNTVIPSGHGLVLANMSYEIRNGLLLSEVVEGGAFAAESPDYELAGLFGCAHSGEKIQLLAKFYGAKKDEGLIMSALAQKIDDFPIEITVEEKKTLSIMEKMPTVIAALAAAQDAAGNIALILYRHPEVDRQRAILILKLVLRSASEDAIAVLERKLREN